MGFEKERSPEDQARVAYLSEWNSFELPEAHLGWLSSKCQTLECFDLTVFRYPLELLRG